MTYPPSSPEGPAGLDAVFGEPELWVVKAAMVSMFVPATANLVVLQPAERWLEGKLEELASGMPRHQQKSELGGRTKTTMMDYDRLAYWLQQLMWARESLNRMTLAAAWMYGFCLSSQP